jgi:FecR protein
MPRLKVVSLLSLATLFTPLLFAQGASQARPGTLNYIEGQATLDGQTLSAQSVGSAELAKGKTLETANGKAEVLLTPGVFLRLDSNSAVTMVSPDLMKTEVQLDRGRAEVEVDQIYKQNDLLVDQGSAQAQLLQNGLYEFDAQAGKMLVFDGKAAVSESQDAKKWIVVKDHHELALNGEPAKAQDFNGSQVASKDQLYNWSKLRSDYLGEANLNLAESYAGDPGFYPGWYWAPGLYSYTWLPGDGLFWSPFGYGFYSPFYLYGGGLVYGHPGFYGRPGLGYRGGYVSHAAPAVHAAPAMHASGGFGGGGFHGGGGGGRR